MQFYARSTFYFVLCKTEQNRTAKTVIYRTLTFSRTIIYSNPRGIILCVARVQINEMCEVHPNTFVTVSAKPRLFPSVEKHQFFRVA